METSRYEDRWGDPGCWAFARIRLTPMLSIALSRWSCAAIEVGGLRYELLTLACDTQVALVNLKALMRKD